MRKFVKSLAVAGGGAAVAVALGAGTAAATGAVWGQDSAPIPAEYSCSSFSPDDARVGINCDWVHSGQVRGYAVCAGVDSNIATQWIGVTGSYTTQLSDYKCRWGIRSHYVEAQG